MRWLEGRSRVDLCPHTTTATVPLWVSGHGQCPVSFPRGLGQQETFLHAGHRARQTLSLQIVRLSFMVLYVHRNHMAYKGQEWGRE